MSPSENRSVSWANGRVFMTSTSRPGRCGLGKAYTSVMSAMGSASARGPEMWSDMHGLPRLGCRLVRGHVEQRSQCWMLQGVGGLGIVEDLLECVVHRDGLADLLHRAAVVAGVATGGLLGTEDEVLDRLQRREALIADDVLEDRVEELERLRGEVLHVRVPGAVEARGEEEPRVVVEGDEACLVDGGDRHLVVARSVAGRVLQVPKGLVESFTVSRLDVEEQAELAGGADADSRPGTCVGTHHRCPVSRVASVRCRAAPSERCH